MDDTTQINNPPSTDTPDIKHVPDLLGYFESTVQALLEHIKRHDIRAAELTKQASQTLEQVAQTSLFKKETQASYERFVKTIETQFIKTMAEAGRAAGEAQMATQGKEMLAGLRPEFQVMVDKAVAAANELRSVSQFLSWKTVASFAVFGIAFAIVQGLISWGFAISLKADLEAEKTQHTEVIPGLKALRDRNIKLQLQLCPDDWQRRMCVRIDPDAKLFGRNKEFAVVQELKK